MGHRSTQAPRISAGSMSSDCPMPYQLYRRPPRPRRPNSGYSLGRTCGSEVQSQCVVCSRCIVSDVPNSPDCTTKASSPAVRHKRTNGSRSHCLRGEVIAWMVFESENLPNINAWPELLECSDEAPRVFYY